MAELLFVETDGSCAHCGIRDNRVLTIHHLKKSKPKDESYDNKLLLCHNCHQSHHQGKGPTTSDLYNIKRRLIIKTLSLPGLNALKEAYRKDLVVAMPFLVNHLIEYGYLSHEDDLMTYENDVVIQAVYKISRNGKKLLDKWKLK
jgi:hypothetical protein